MVGGTVADPVTGLSYGDTITLPAAPTKDGSSFIGWYKDEALTRVWSFSDGVGGAMTLYAKNGAKIRYRLRQTPQQP